MKNPATIPPRVMAHIESDMARMADLQATRRHVVRHHGMVEWRWLSTTPYERHARDRLQAARAIREARRLIRANGYDVAEVCSIARDPDAFAHCDGGGALARDFR